MVLVTGGTSGIGLETVKLFASRGFQVQTCARNRFNFTQVTDSASVRNISCSYFDIGETQKLSQWIEQIGKQFGKIDLLVNNAAAVIRKPLLEMTSPEIQHCLNVNLAAVVESSKSALPFFDSQAGAMIINLSSMAAIDPFAGFSVYGACKAFIELFTKSLAGEIANRNVRCYSIRAGTVATPLLRRVLPSIPDSDCLPASTIARLILELHEKPTAYPSGDAIEITRENSDSIFHKMRYD